MDLHEASLQLVPIHCGLISNNILPFITQKQVRQLTDLLNLKSIQMVKWWLIKLHHVSTKNLGIHHWWGLLNTIPILHKKEFQLLAPVQIIPSQCKIWLGCIPWILFVDFLFKYLFDCEFWITKFVLPPFSFYLTDSMLHIG